MSYDKPPRWSYWPKSTAEYESMSFAERAHWHATLGLIGSIVAVVFALIAVLFACLTVIWS